MVSGPMVVWSRPKLKPPESEKTQEVRRHLGRSHIQFQGETTAKVSNADMGGVQEAGVETGVLVAGCDAAAFAANIALLLIMYVPFREDLEEDAARAAAMLCYAIGDGRLKGGWAGLMAAATLHPVSISMAMLVAFADGQGRPTPAGSMAGGGGAPAIRRLGFFGQSDGT